MARGSATLIGRRRIKSAARNATLVAIGQRIHAARVAHLRMTQAQLGAFVGQSSGRGVQDNERGLTMPSGDTLHQLAHEGINVHWVLTGEGAPRLDVAAWTVVPDPADQPLFALGREVATAFGFDVHADLIGFRLQDQSMAPVMAMSDIVVCDRGMLDTPFEGWYLLSLDGDYVVRRLDSRDRSIVISAANRLYGDIEMSRTDLRDDGVTIVGRVVARFTATS
jgi:hypothetical protein